ncbi:MAG: hypothetical protein KAT52_02955 [Desulfobacterales bacterium]|nr:hypothetical protein [Desulfobacterales bacterium]
MFLLGTGLIGVGAFGRRKIKNGSKRLIRLEVSFIGLIDQQVK